MSFNSTPYKSRPAPGQLGSTPFRSSSANKFRSSLVPMSRPSPARPSNSPSKSTKTATTTKARDLFRTSTPRSQRTAEFAPDLPAAATRPPPSMRKFAPRKSVSSGMSNTGSTEPFKMRIPSPDPDLTGRAIAKEVPDDPNRIGSIYADQFLAHKCPSHFDEIQRRQFFCILDLRRLKYAADEIFAKKDWKLNIVNFAKEYEKSRGLIMLRYGLYEFHNVKPSSEVLKKWRAAHGLPAESDEDRKPGLENGRTPGHATSTKRKAEEQLAPKDNALMASTANQNKRRNLAKESDDSTLTESTPFKKSKRKMEEDEEDENKPSKQQRSTPSSATSLFESILNKPRNGAASPAKPTYKASSLFGTPKPKASQDTKSNTKDNPFASSNGSTLFGSTKTADAHTASRSVLSGHKIGSTPVTNTGNIFSYLSESPSESSGNENENAEDRETDSEPEQDVEDQDAGVEVKATPVQNTPSLFATPKLGTASNIFGGLSKPADQPAKGGLFGRVQMDANGQPARASPVPEDKPLKGNEQQTKTPTMPAGDYTFNPATTPISFGQPTIDKSKSSAITDADAGAKQPASEFKKPTPVFGTSSEATSTPKPNASSLFGLAGSAKPKSSEGSTSIFGSQKPTPASSNIFGAASSSFGAKSPFVTDETADAVPAAAKKQAASIFDKPASLPPAVSETKSTLSAKDDKGASSAPTAGHKASSIFDKSFIEAGAAQVKASRSMEPSTGLFNRQSNPLFSNGDASKESKADNSKTDTATPAVKKQATSIFDKSFIADSAAQIKALPESAKPSVDLFSRNANPLFGAPKPNSSDGAASQSIFGQADKQANTATPQSKDEVIKENQVPASGSNAPAVSIFGSQGSSGSSAPASTLFGEKKLNDTTKPAANIFAPSTAAPATTPFGAKKADEPTKPASSIFGTQVGSGLSKSTSTPFGGMKSGEPTKSASNIFGGQANSGLSSSTTMLFGETKSAAPASSFGSAPGGNSAIFSFGSQPNSGADIQSPATTFGAGPTPNASISFGAAGPQANGDKPKSMGFQFGGPAPGAGSSSFTFGQDSGASSFTFTAGTDKQAVNNPFAASQSSAQPPAPAFGGNSFATTPNASFNFSFGQPAASTPKAAPTPGQGAGLFGGSVNTNGAPSFSFTQASPSQSLTENKFSKSSAMNPFGHLQASDGNLGGNSPFPAPSSIGTTPVNGTPEPQSPRDDGDEAPQEQIKLTEGGPGEEDEVMLHEVRAKVIKYIPVQKEDEDAPKSPWSTRGVGPLRVLKNKSTGTVRILLRAEPRGHIAMNKTILPDVEYKAKEKTISFVAASDDGSNLETWLLQVKKPELANELASILEANKSANKK